jgi:hypothetical protein
MAFDLDGVFNFGSKIIERIWPDPTEAEKAKIKLAELAQNGQLAEMANETKLFEAEVEDRKSARDRESAVVTSAEAPYINKIILPVLALGVLVCSFVLFGLVVFDNDVIDSSRKDIVIYILGVLSAIDTQIVAFYFGSSSGSAQKTDFMEKLLK